MLRTCIVFAVKKNDYINVNQIKPNQTKLCILVR